MRTYIFYLSGFIALLFTIMSCAAEGQTRTDQQQIYELKVYHLENESQEDRLDDYLQNAYLPAMHRQGNESIGVFSQAGQDTLDQRLIYVLTAHDSADEIVELSEALAEDETYLGDGADYLEASPDNPPYHRIETILMEAFSYAPVIQTPELESPKSERIYELRSYESATEPLNINKVEMFNEGGEIEIFDRLDFNAVFYGNVIAGNNMPNLMYMTSFENMDDRDDHWDAFRTDQAWDELSAMEKYQDNVSHIDIHFLRAKEYSDL